MNKLINGKTYYKSKEESYNNCSGCIAEEDNDNELCEILRGKTGYCIDTGMIWKLEDKEMNIENKIKSKAIEILNRDLLEKAKELIEKSELDDMVDCSLDDIINEEMRELLEGLYYNQSDKTTDEYINSKIEKDCEKFISLFERGETSKPNSEIFPQIKECAISLLKLELINEVALADFSDLENYYMADFYSAIEDSLTPEVYVFINRLITDADEDQVKEMIKYSIIADVDKLINSI